MNILLKKLGKRKGLSDEQIATLDSMMSDAEEGKVDLEAVSDLPVINNDLPEFIKSELNAQLQTQKALLEKKGHDVEVYEFSREDIAVAFKNLPWTEAMNRIGELFAEEQTKLYRLIADEMGLSEEEVEEVF